MRRCAKRALRAVGLDVSRVRPGDQLWKRNERDNRHLVAVMAVCLKEGSRCVDVGAHQGQMTESMVRLAPAGQHFAFEPIPHLATSLRERFPLVEVHQIALSDKAGRSDYGYVPAKPALSGLRPTARPSFRIQTLSVDVATLDEILDGTDIDFLKVDVEGAELQVLRGALQTLHASRPVIAFEHSRMTFDDGMLQVLDEADCATNREIFQLLVEDLGFRLFDLDGMGPLTGAEFRRLYETVERFNFLAVP
jgi:FkbM family methyltransferase